MQYFGLGSSLFIVAAVITTTLWHLTTPDIIEDQYASVETMVDKAANKEDAFAKLIRSALNEAKAKSSAKPRPTIIRVTSFDKPVPLHLTSFKRH